MASETAPAAAGKILQVLLFREKESASELGPALWSALQEIESLFRSLPSGQFDRVFVGPSVPSGIPSADSRAVAPPSAEWDALWRGAGGRLPQLYAHRELGLRTLALLGKRADGAALVVITDQELVPPRRWRYVIWDTWEGGTVISVAPADPRYWRDRDEARTLTIKRRMRAAAASATGTLLGLSRCHNPRCFLYQPVESVVQLDDMGYIGSEHDRGELAGKGFIDRSRSVLSRLLTPFGAAYPQAATIGPIPGPDDEGDLK